VIARMVKSGMHGLNVQIATNYEAVQPTKAFSSVDVDGAVVNGRYDVWPQPRDLPARAVRLWFTETGATGDGMQPVNVTLELTRNPGKMSRSLRTLGGK
jgi:hypothetical protein